LNECYLIDRLCGVYYPLRLTPGGYLSTTFNRLLVLYQLVDGVHSNEQFYLQYTHRHLPVNQFLVNSPMSTPPTPASLSNFQSIFHASLRAYEKQTKNDLLSHPLAARLHSCDSPAAILTVLQDQVQEFEQSRSVNQRLTKWLDPTVNVLYAFSATLGEGVGLVNLNKQARVTSVR